MARKKMRITPIDIAVLGVIGFIGYQMFKPKPPVAGMRGIGYIGEEPGLVEPADPPSSTDPLVEPADPALQSPNDVNLVRDTTMPERAAAAAALPTPVDSRLSPINTTTHAWAGGPSWLQSCW